MPVWIKTKNRCLFEMTLKASFCAWSLSIKNGQIKQSTGIQTLANFSTCFKLTSSSLFVEDKSVMVLDLRQ